jgi:hypothetical protein
MLLVEAETLDIVLDSCDEVWTPLDMVVVGTTDEVKVSLQVLLKPCEDVIAPVE